MFMDKFIVDGYECILCHEIYVVIQGIEEDEGCPKCGGTSNFLETVEVDIE